MMPVLSSCLKINLYYSTVFFINWLVKGWISKRQFKRGALRTWPIFGVLHGLRVLTTLVFGFRFSSTMMTVLGFFLSGAFYGFSGFAKKVKEVTPRSRAKTGVIPRDLLYSVLPFIKWNG